MKEIGYKKTLYNIISDKELFREFKENPNNPCIYGVVSQLFIKFPALNIEMSEGNSSLQSLSHHIDECLQSQDLYRLKEVLLEGSLDSENIEELSKFIDDFLDGPNGFGKTSIFDVIEFVLTNQIRRIGKADSRGRFKDILFRNDSSKDCVIKVEFENREDNIKFTIVKIIKANKLTNKNSPRDFSVFDTHILENFDEEMNESNIVEDTEELQLIL
ncbi:ATP-binding protein [Bacillus cereus]|nr:ATP-binding protein [Bacillus cereus]MEB9571277.1 ATP-binding protein [Bacillus cereus]